MADKQLNAASRELNKFAAIWRKRFKNKKFLDAHVSLAIEINKKLNEVIPLIEELKMLDKRGDRDAAKYAGLEAARKRASE